MLVKTCKECGSDFPTSRSNQRFCRTECRRMFHNRNWYVKHRSDIREKADVYRSAFTERAMLASAKYRAKQRDLPFDLTAADIILPEKCPVLGLTLDYNLGKGSGLHHNSPSLDRKVPSKGYVKGNVRVISARANHLKSDASLEEMELVLADLRNLS